MTTIFETIRSPTADVGEVARRAGVATSALRFYEMEGLIHSERTPAGHRRYHADVLRRVSFIRTAQLVGLSLSEIREALSSLPDGRTPTAQRLGAARPLVASPCSTSGSSS